LRFEFNKIVAVFQRRGMMGPVDLTIEQLSLDTENPRINSAASQREALEKVIADEAEKLIRLARSIARRGLNPMDRLLVFRPKGSRTYIAVEGNRRVAALGSGPIKWIHNRRVS
jgi:hypothetical protein